MNDDMTHPCPICRDTGIAHSAPYMMGLVQGDLYTITVCSCSAGKRLTEATRRPRPGPEGGGVNGE